MKNAVNISNPIPQKLHFFFVVGSTYSSLLIKINFYVATIVLHIGLFIGYFLTSEKKKGNFYGFMEKEKEKGEFL